MIQAFRSTRVLTPDGLVPATLLVDDGRISAIERRIDAGWGEVPADGRLRDYGDLVLLPGLVDSHVHINEPGRTDWEGFETATRAAAAGGVTTLVDMPLNCIPETINVKALDAKRAAAEGKTWVDWAAWGGAVHGNSDALKPLARTGIPGFKCFLIHSGIDGFAWVDERDLRFAMAQLQSTGLPLLAHAEVALPVNSATEKLNAGKADWRRYSTYLASRPDAAELDAIALLIQLAEEYETPVHIVHLSSAKALPLIAEARARGVQVSVETCVHYLWFAAEEIPDGATEYKCAPPIREAANREALWQALGTGELEMVITDHSPCPPAMKRREEGRWDLAWGGIAGLGLALPVLWTSMAGRGFGIEKLGVWMGAAPARLAGLTGRKGTLVVGADADIVVFDPDAAWTVSAKDLHFRHKISPYLGANLKGSVRETWLRGEQIFGAGRSIGAARGRELVRG